MQPNIQLNYTAILLATTASFFLGFIWYSFLFNKSWIKEMGIDAPVRPQPKQMVSILLTNFVATFLMVYVFSHNQQVWDARTWGHSTTFMANYPGAIMGAVFTWIGFFIPQDLNKKLFQMKSWKLVFIDTSFNLCSLLITALILASFMK